MRFGGAKMQTRSGCIVRFDPCLGKRKRRLPSHAHEEDEDLDSDKPSSALQFQNLVQDVLHIVFNLLPPEHLYKSVGLACRSWRESMMEPFFAERHLSSHRHPQKLLLQAVSANKKEPMTVYTVALPISGERASAMSFPSVSTSPQGEQPSVIVASFDGLLLIRHIRPKDEGDDAAAMVLEVLNPLTKKHRQLTFPLRVRSASEIPKFMVPTGGHLPKYIFRMEYSLGYDPIAKEYKVICVFEREEGGFLCAFCSVGSDSWRWLEMPCDNIRFSLAPVSTRCGTLHWLVERRQTSFPGMLKTMMLSLDMRSEEFRTTPLPFYSHFIIDSCNLFKLRGRPAVMYGLSWGLEFWVLEDNVEGNEGETWVKRHETQATEWLQVRRLHSADVVAIGCLNEEEVIFANQRKQIFAYNMMVKKVRRVLLLDRFFNSLHALFLPWPVLVHSTSLVSPMSSSS